MTPFAFAAFLLEGDLLAFRPGLDKGPVSPFAAAGHLLKYKACKRCQRDELHTHPSVHPTLGPCLRIHHGKPSCDCELAGCPNPVKPYPAIKGPLDASEGRRNRMLRE